MGAYVRECGRPVERLTRADRLAVLARLDEAKIFAVRRATPVVAGALRSPDPPSTACWPN
ncbi:helix-turn-helix domain-containing protein [Kitasatospora cinereorecta]